MVKNIGATAKIVIDTAFITLGQFLKLADVISSGGQAKEFLASHPIRVNGIDDNRRGRKLYPGDRVTIENHEFELASS
jgi:ribosome-associated protein